MAYTEAQKRASIKYLTEKTDDIRIRLPKGTKERWRHFAQLSGKSMTVYVHDAVEAQITYDECGEHELDPEIIPNLTDWLKAHRHTADEILDCITALGKKND